MNCWPGRRFTLVITIATSLWAPSARAHVPAPSIWRALQEPDPTRSEAAEAFEAGEAAFEAGDFEAAIEQFTRAQQLLPHPSTAYNLGLAQARAGRTLEAWATFTEIRDAATDPERRTEAELQLARLSPSVAQVQVRASPGQVVRLDGEPIEPNVVLVRAPGPASVDIGDQTLDVELEGGQVRLLDVRTIERRIPPAPPKASRVAVLATTVALGAGTAGTATAAALLGPDGPGRPLAYSAAGLGGATLIFATTALVLHLRDRKAARNAR